jgi:hypothetical protein
MKTTTSLLVVFTILALGMSVAIRGQTAPTSPSELLEKGIYAQDTKGDLDSAIAIYQQLVAEQDINHSLAAQAQFRLGQCYVKQNRTADATAAFQKLIHDYPNETNLVAQAREYVPGGVTFGPVPWVDGERLQLDIVVASGADIGVAEYRADLVPQASGSNIWRVGCRMMAAGAQSVSSVDADADTFRPITGHWKHSLLGEVTTVYSASQVQVQRVGKTQPETIPVEGVVYDNEEAMHAMRRLPLQVGYKTTISVVAALAAATVLPIGIEVVGKETVETPAGKFDCYKVHLNINQDFWFSDDAHRYLVKYEAGGILAQLISVAQRRPGEAVAFHDDETGASFSAPADWVVWRARAGQPEGQVLIRTLDPGADTSDGGVRLFATDTLSEKARQSARAWMGEYLQTLKNIRVRPDSWKDLTIDGRPAVSSVADYTEGGKSHVYYMACVLGPKYSEWFVIASVPDKFDALKAQFDTIVASYRTK